VGKPTTSEKRKKRKEKKFVVNGKELGTFCTEQVIPCQKSAGVARGGGVKSGTESWRGRKEKAKGI